MKKYLFIMCFMSLMAIPASAEFTVDDTVDDVYLKNHGYSKNTIQIVNKKVAETSGNAYVKPAEHEIYETPVAKYVRRFFTYIDPALDDDSFSNNHNMNPSARWNDL